MSHFLYLSLPGTQHLEWLYLFLLSVPRYRFGVDDGRLDCVFYYFGHALYDIWILAGVVFRVSTVYVNFTTFQYVNLQNIGSMGTSYQLSTRAKKNSLVFAAQICNINGKAEKDVSREYSKFGLRFSALFHKPCFNKC